PAPDHYAVAFGDDILEGDLAVGDGPAHLVVRHLPAREPRGQVGHGRVADHVTSEQVVQGVPVVCLPRLLDAADESFVLLEPTGSLVEFDHPPSHRTHRVAGAASLQVGLNRGKGPGEIHESSAAMPRAGALDTRIVAPL